MTQPINPVKDYYADYVFNSTLPVITFNSYEEILTASKGITKSCILYNTKNQTVSSKALNIDLSYDSSLEVILILNVEFTGLSTVSLKGKNYSVSNITLKDGDSTKAPGSFIVDVVGENIKLINFSMINYKIKATDRDYVRVAKSGKKFQLHNSLLDGKSINGVFLRLDFPENHLIKQCVCKNFIISDITNGGEMIRLATSGFEKSKAYCVIDSCYFTKCNGDPEVVSVKCSNNTIKNCIFENNYGKLVLRHAHDCVVEHNYFSNNGMRVYGTNHKIINNQVVDNANILLDNKTGSSYVVAENVLVDVVWYKNSPKPVTNKGKNCVVKNVNEGLVITKESLLNGGIVPPPPITPSSFKFSTKTRPVNQTTPIIAVNEEYTVEYIATKKAPFTFKLYDPNNVVVKTQIEKTSPYFLYGDNNFGKLSVIGKYKLVIIETKDEVSFEVVNTIL
jgi:parallel beta-helix repeat protein